MKSYICQVKDKDIIMINNIDNWFWHSHAVLDEDLALLYCIQKYINILKI